MTKTLLTLAGAVLCTGLAAAQPDGRMAPGSGSGSAPGTGATGPSYEDTQVPKSNPDAGSGSTGRDGEEPRGSLGAGRIEPGGSGAGTTSTTRPAARR
jgi:hypothetical protein